MSFHKDLTGADIHETVVTILADSPVTLSTVASIAGMLAIDNSIPGVPKLYKANSTSAGDWAKISGGGGGGGGGGGSGGRWAAGATNPAPAETIEFDQDVWKFSPGGGQSLYSVVKVPTSYSPGSQANMTLDVYSPSTSGTARLKVKATLIRKNTDAADSTTNQRTSTNSVITLDATAKKLWQVTLDLTDSLGKINSVAVSPEDQLKLELFRDPADSDTADLRFLIGTSDFQFQ